MNYSFPKYFVVILCFLLLSGKLFSQSDTKIDRNYEIDDININFKGLKTFTESELKNILASKEGEPFDMETYLNDASRIRKYYFDNGFFDTKVDTNLVYKKSDMEVDANFMIRENRRYVYYKLEYSGLDNVPENIMNMIYNTDNTFLRTGGFYNKDTIKLEQARVLNILFNNGYAIASADNPLVLKIESNEVYLQGKVNIDLKFIPHEQFTYGTTKIIIKGKRYNLTESDISRELTYSEGQLYNKSQVVSSELNISKITLLDNPRINIDSVDTTNRKINFEINALVGNKYELTPELFGYYFQNSFYIGTGLSYADNYFLGGGRVLTSSARIYFNSIDNNRFEFLNNLYQPFLFNNRNISGNWNLGIQYNIDEFKNVTEIKNSFIVNFDLPTYTYINKISTNWDLVNQRLSLKQDIVAEDTVLVSSFTLNSFESLLGLTLIHNTVNNIKFPFDGIFQSYSFEESGLLGNLVKKIFSTTSTSYFKFSNFNSGYKNLSNSNIQVPAVLAAKIYSGIIIEYGENNYNFQGYEIQGDLVPDDTRFVCGGTTSVRGWGAKQLGIVADKNVGGNFIVETSVEYRLRPFLDNSNIYIRDLGFASFIDVGNVWSEIGKFKLNQLAFASGAGIRYYTIVGAIRLDMGFKIYDPQPGSVGGSNWLFGPGSNFSDKYHLQFGIGNTF